VDAWSRAIIPDAQAEDALNLLLAKAPAEFPRGDLPAGLPRSPYSMCACAPARCAKWPTPWPCTLARASSAGKKKNWCTPLQKACGCPICVIAAAWTATLAQLRLVELQSVVQLYRALGGGWQ
jgi:hypothetical protein